MCDRFVHDCLLVSVKPDWRAAREGEGGLARCETGVGGPVNQNPGQVVARRGRESSVTRWPVSCASVTSGRHFQACIDDKSLVFAELISLVTQTWVRRIGSASRTLRAPESVVLYRETSRGSGAVVSIIARVRGRSFRAALMGAIASRSEVLRT